MVDFTAAFMDLQPSIVDTHAISSFQNFTLALIVYDHEFANQRISHGNRTGSSRATRRLRTQFAPHFDGALTNLKTS